MIVRHRCDNPPCINPDHLELGTNADNMRDMSTRGRSLRGEKNPKAKLTEDDVRTIRRRYAEEGISTTRLGDEYGISSPMVSYIVLRKNWSHVD